MYRPPGEKTQRIFFSVGFVKMRTMNFDRRCAGKLEGLMINPDRELLKMINPSMLV